MAEVRLPAHAPELHDNPSQCRRWRDRLLPPAPLVRWVSVLIDCGLFQGAGTSREGAGAERLGIRFAVDRVRALVVTHVHIDHVGRIPHLLAAGYRGPIVCSQASAALLPLVLEDAKKIGCARDPALVGSVLKQIRQQTIAVPHKQWRNILNGDPALRVCRRRGTSSAPLMSNSIWYNEATASASFSPATSERRTRPCCRHRDRPMRRPARP